MHEGQVMTIIGTYEGDLHSVMFLRESIGLMPCCRLRMSVCLSVWIWSNMHSLRVYICTYVRMYILYRHYCLSTYVLTVGIKKKFTFRNSNTHRFTQ